MFVFNEDGTIAGVVDKPADSVSNKTPNYLRKSDEGKDKKFGRLSSQLSFGSASDGKST